MAQFLARTLLKFANFPLHHSATVRILKEYHRSPVHLSVLGPVSSEQQLADNLTATIKSTINAKSLLDIASVNARSLTPSHIVQFMKQLDDLSKNDHTQKRQICASAQFEALCRKLRSVVGALDEWETIGVLRNLLYLGVQPDSTITMTLLHVLKGHVNELNLRQIMQAHLLLNTLMKNVNLSLVDGLKMALPIVFAVRLPMQLFAMSTEEMLDCWRYATQHNQTNQEVLQKLHDSLYKRVGELNVHQAKRIIWDCTSLERNVWIHSLYDACQNLLIREMKALSIVDVSISVTRMLRRWSHRTPYYASFAMLETFVDYAIDNNLDVNEISDLIRKFASLEFYSHRLIDRLHEQIRTNPGCLIINDATNATKPQVILFSLLLAMSSNFYPKDHWNECRKLINGLPTVGDIPANRALPLDRFGEIMCLAGVYREDVLRQCLAPEHMQRVLDINTPTNYRRYLTMWHCCTLDNLPEFVSRNFNPATFNVTRLADGLRNTKAPAYTVGQALRFIFGETQVASDLVAPSCGYIADHVVVLRSDGTALPIQMQPQPQQRCTTNFVEDIIMPEDGGDCKILMVQCLPKYYFPLYGGTVKPLRHFAVAMRLLIEHGGYYVVPVAEAHWKSMADYEKISFLVQAINEECNVRVTVARTQREFKTPLDSKREHSQGMNEEEEADDCESMESITFMDADKNNSGRMNKSKY